MCIFLLLQKVKIRLLSRGRSCCVREKGPVRERGPIACIPQSIAHEAARETRRFFLFPRPPSLYLHLHIILLHGH